MQEIILSNIELWINGEEEKYIEKLSKRLDLKSNEVSRRFHKRIEPLSKKQLSDANFKFLLILSEIIKKIHEKAVNGIVEEIENEFNTKQLPKVTKIMQSFSEQNDLDFSLLLNLAVLRKYALLVKEEVPFDIFNEYYQKVLSTIKEELKK